MLDKIFTTSNKESQAVNSPEEDYYRFIKQNLHLSTFSLNNKYVLEDQAILQWRIEAPNVVGLSKDQKTLNKVLLDYIHSNNISKLKELLNKNKNNENLKAVLDLKRGKTGLTLLHVLCMNNNYSLTKDLLSAGANPNIQDCDGKTPLYYAYSNDLVNVLMENKADPNIRDKRGKTPLHYCAEDKYPNDETILRVKLLLWNGADLSVIDKDKKTPMQIAIDNNYCNTECFFNNKQKKLHEELYKMINSLSTTDNNQKLESLKNFLDQHKGNEDLKIILSNKDEEGNLKVLEAVPKDDVYANVRKFIEGVAPIKKEVWVKEERNKKATRGLFDTYLEQQHKIKLKFADKLSQVKNMTELQTCINDIINSGVMLNFIYRKNPKENTGKRQIYFLDYVIEKIGKLEENPEVASEVICKLISRGAELGETSSLKIFDKQASKHEKHIYNTIEAYESNLNLNRKFVEIAEGAAIVGKLDSAIVDNATFYLKYSRDSKIDVAKVTDGAKSLGLVNGNIVRGKDIIKIGKSEVEVETCNGKRNYTNLADGSDVVLTFYTSEGELKVRLYTDIKSKDLVKIEVVNQETLAKLKGNNEIIGVNCSLGGLSVNEAINKGFFIKSEKSQLPEVMQSYQEFSKEGKKEDKKQCQNRLEARDKVPIISAKNAYPRNEKLDVLESNIKKMLNEQQIVNNRHDSNQIQNMADTNNKTPLSLLNDTTIRPANSKKEITSVG